MSTVFAYTGQCPHCRSRWSWDDPEPMLRRPDPCPTCGGRHYQWVGIDRATWQERHDAH